MLAGGVPARVAGYRFPTTPPPAWVECTGWRVWCGSAGQHDLGLCPLPPWVLLRGDCFQALGFLAFRVSLFGFIVSRYVFLPDFDVLGVTDGSALRWALVMVGWVMTSPYPAGFVR